MVDMVDRFRAERLFLSNQVAGITIKDNQELKPHFQEFVVKNEEEKAKLETKLNELRKANDDQQKKIDVRGPLWLLKCQLPGLFKFDSGLVILSANQIKLCRFRISMKLDVDILHKTSIIIVIVAKLQKPIETEVK